MHGEIGGDIKLNVSPPYFAGTRYPIGLFSKGIIKSGCIKKPLRWWQENITRCAEEYGYTENQVKEYELYIDFLGKWMELYGLD